MPSEATRLEEATKPDTPWRKWGPYLSERQWGTVREDYSESGDAWNYFSHDQARLRAYRWGEDGLAGICDERQRLCFALALWNGADPILKERLFGLTNGEGNHGEDVKEYYFYLDSTPTHSYMKYLYKYPQRAYPYETLVQRNRHRNRYEMEYELLDTGIFDDDRYFDVFAEYAKGAPEDILIRLSVVNRGPEAATLHLLPTLWYRNTWSWTAEAPRPSLRRVDGPAGVSAAVARDVDGRESLFACEGNVPLLFTENETNAERIFGTPNRTPYVKDAIDRFVVHGQRDAVNPAGTGTKVAAHYTLRVDPGATTVVRLRLTTPVGGGAQGAFGRDFDAAFQARQREADEFYATVIPARATADEALVMRQALAGMLWSKQSYNYDVGEWLRGRGLDPSNPRLFGIRNGAWAHMANEDVISMPDKWEYPWYAAWDLAFHTVAMAPVDLPFAKQQLLLMLEQQYLHPSGQIPAYEWNFGDVNPPVHAWAAWYIYNQERVLQGAGDLEFLRQVFQKLVINFTWWVNRKDPTGLNIFQGGFLGLDNIGVFDRSAPLPTGGTLEQADGTAWMAFYCQCMLQIARELAEDDPTFLDLALKFYEHFLWIASAMDRVGQNNDELWDEGDGFFYDVLRLPNGHALRLKVRSMVGLLSLCASTVFPGDGEERFPEFVRRAKEFMDRHPHLAENISPPARRGYKGRRLLALLNEDKLRRVLARMLDENEFLSPFGIRALSRYHLEHPYVFSVDRAVYRVDYEPAESTSGLFGGNSNWRGPIWLPVNALLLRGLANLYAFYGNDFTVECPTGSGRQMNLYEVMHELGRRLIRIFLRDEQGARPVHGGAHKFQADPHWRDLLLFYEYFHGDNGSGLGASHQTGWTGLVAPIIQLQGTLDAQGMLDAFDRRPRAPVGAAAKRGETARARRPARRKT
jgi:Mannosylglycerate hydrolase MGH1-like glycoside hydrolase domain